MPRIPTKLALALSLFVGGAGPLALPSTAHELWLDATPYQFDPGKAISAQLKNGQRFKGVSLIYNRRDFTRFEVHSGKRARPIQGRLGDVPAVRIAGLEAGLTILVYESTPDKVTYKSWEKFKSFAAHKAFADIERRHDARGLARSDFTEVYTRHVKALIAVGEGAGEDRVLGLETEIVAVKNPYTDLRLGGKKEPRMVIDLLYRNSPRANARIEIFDQAPDGTVRISTRRTDERGRGEFPVTPGHTYLVDAVLLREPSPPRAAKFNAVWETLWAALTFKVPAR